MPAFLWVLLALVVPLHGDPLVSVWYERADREGEREEESYAGLTLSGSWP